MGVSEPVVHGKVVLLGALAMLGAAFIAVWIGMAAFAVASLPLHLVQWLVVVVVVYTSLAMLRSAASEKEAVVHA